MQHGQVLGDRARRDAETAGQRRGGRGGAQRGQQPDPRRAEQGLGCFLAPPPSPAHALPAHAPPSHTVAAPRAGYSMMVWVLVARLGDTCGQLKTLGMSTTPSGPSVILKGGGP